MKNVGGAAAGVYETLCFLVPLGMWAGGAHVDWYGFWYVWLVINFLLAMIFSLWFSAGGILDLQAFFLRLSTVC